MKHKSIYVADADREKADLYKAHFSRRGYAAVSPRDVYCGRDASAEDELTSRLRALLSCDCVYVGNLTYPETMLISAAVCVLRQRGGREIEIIGSTHNL